MTHHVALRYLHRHHLVAVVDEVVEAPPGFVDVRGFAQDLPDRIGLAAVPVRIEDRCEVRNDIADDEDVHVHEVAGGAPGKVFVGDVPTAHHGHRSVGD